MALSKQRLGDFIELLECCNVDLRYGENAVRGVNNLKLLMPTKVDVSSRDLSKFQIVKSGEFVFNHRTSRNGSKFSIAYNDTSTPVICTEDYVVFRITDEGQKRLLARWLYVFFDRPEFDRYVITNSWGSSTEFYNWEDVCAVELDLPPLPIQQKYVDIYSAMLENQRCYERGLEDLKLTIDATIDRLKFSAPRVAVGTLLEDVDQRNTDGMLSDVQGINIDKQFMPSVASLDGVDITRYKIMRRNQFAYSAMQTGRDECVRIALHQGDIPLLVSPAYSVLQRKSTEALEEYIMMWFSRNESDRLGWFMSDASIRANLDLVRFFEIEIPLPTKEQQKALVDIYDAYISRREINERLKAQLKDLCPILIKGSLEDAGKE